MHESYLPQLWTAIQAHPSLVRLPRVWEGVLEIVSSAPRSAALPPLVIGTLDYEPYNLHRLMELVTQERLHVDTIQLSVADEAVSEDACQLRDTTVAGLTTVIFDRVDNEIEGLSNSADHFLPSLLDRNPSIRNLVTTLRHSDPGPLFTTPLWMSLLDVPGLAALGDARLEWLWESRGAADDTTNAYLELTEPDSTGQRALKRLAVNADVWNRPSQSWAELNVRAIEDVAICLPDLVYLDFRQQGDGRSDKVCVLVQCSSVQTFD